MTQHRFELFADYFQFYLQDDDQELGNLAEAWTPEAVDRLLAVAVGTVGIGTVRNMDVPVTVEVHDGEPQPELESWDHIAECDLEVKSGRVVVAGCTDYFPDAARIPVAPGLYRVRASYGGLDSLSEDGLEGSDRYRVQIWPSRGPGTVLVVKQRSRS
jgi:hypothetical protein